MQGEKIVANVSCSEVLEELSLFADGQLPKERVKQLQEHVLGCHVCEQFGADFAATVGALRSLGKPAALDEEIAKRLRDALFRDE